MMEEGESSWSAVAVGAVAGGIGGILAKIPLVKEYSETVCEKHFAVVFSIVITTFIILNIAKIVNAK
ncbi:MAG: hypothetical protein LBS71_03050, partial [Puniceicoccales bacterium]|nr:hypothetical protein [Puniceicoccales bacterium]